MLAGKILALVTLAPLKARFSKSDHSRSNSSFSNPLNIFKSSSVCIRKDKLLRSFGIGILTLPRVAAKLFRPWETPLTERIDDGTIKLWHTAAKYVINSSGLDACMEAN